MQEERRRLREHGPVVMDDDGNVIKVEDPRGFLEVAHILSHSLVKVEKDLQLVSYYNKRKSSLRVY